MYFARKRHYILNSNLKLQTLLFPVGPSMRLRRGQGWGEWGDTGGGDGAAWMEAPRAPGPVGSKWRTALMTVRPSLGYSGAAAQPLL